MKRKLILLLGCLTAVPTLSTAAEIICGNVNDDARTYFKSGLSATRTLSGKDCTISIDGATATSTVAGATTTSTTAQASSNAAVCLAYFTRDRRVLATLSDVIATQIVPLLVIASIPKFPPFTTTVDDVGVIPDENACMNYINRVQATQPTVDSTIQHVFGSSFPGISQCLSKGSSSGDVQCEQRDGALDIDFKSSFGAHSITIPYLSR
jgi:hypothetical protein